MDRTANEIDQCRSLYAAPFVIDESTMMRSGEAEHDLQAPLRDDVRRE
jgi:hypothetical protein